MPLIINKELGFDSKFIYSYLPNYIYKLAINDINKQRLEPIDQEFSINSYDIIKYALSNLRVSETSLDYCIGTNKNLKYNDISIELLLNLITYGNASVKGYPFITSIFEFVSKHIYYIYEEWEEA